MFTGDAAGTVSGTAPNTTAAATQYWGASGTHSDAVVTALGYIPEDAWNDTTASIAANGGLSASGGGASIFFPKPSWQTGTGVPSDSKRDVPDISVSASPDHDGYLVCSTDGDPSSCTTGFRDSSTPTTNCPQGSCFTVVGGTSAAAPTFSAILAIIQQYVGPAGLAPINPTLYSLAASTPAAFHDVTSGNNIVPCTSGTTGCPSAGQFGFTAGVGYDQVTGLGSVNAFNLAQAISTAPGFSLTATPSSYQVTQGASVTATVNLTPINGFTGMVTYTCNDTVSESTCTGPTTATANTSVSFVITTKAPVARLERPFDRGAKIFCATLFPGLLGIVFVAGSRKRSLRGVRFLGLLMALGFSTMWLGSCGGSSSSTKDPGTPTGTYSITVSGAATVNGAPVTRQTTIQLVVVP